MVSQTEIKVGPYPRGFHIITENVFDKIPKITGIVHLFIKHTSASLTINENADPTVREDFKLTSTRWCQKKTHTISTPLRGQMI